MSRRRFQLALCAAAVPLVALPSDVDAQAWPAPARTGGVVVSTQVIENTGHLMTDGFLLEDTGSRNVSVSVEVDYAVTDRLSVTAGVPYVFAKWVGPLDSPAKLPIDECRCWQSGWQDLGATVRYAVVDGDFALTPSVSLGVPTNNYPYQGEAVVGFGLREARFAVDAGWRLTALSPRLALQGRYSYALVQDVDDVPDVANNRSNWSVTGSVAITARLSTRIGTTWQRTHGGLRAGSVTGNPFAPFGEADDTPERWAQHDRLLRDNNWRMSAGFTYMLPHADVFFSYMHFMGGTDTHAGRALTIGTSVPFRLTW